MSKLRAFTMPKWGIEMTEGSLSEWLISEGETFTQGQILAAIETDKIVNDVEADYDAVCLRLVAQPNHDYAVGALLAVFGESDVSSDEVDRFINGFVANGEFKQDEYGNEPEQEILDDVAPVDQNSTEPSQELEQQSIQFDIPSDISISVKAAELASKQAIDFSQVTVSGNKGRILLQDIQQYLKGAEPAANRGSAIDNKYLFDLDIEKTITPVALKFAREQKLDFANIKGTGKNQRVRLRDLSSLLQTKSEVQKLQLNGQRGQVTTQPFSRMRNHIAERLTRSQREIPHYYIELDVDVNKLVAARDKYNSASKVKATINDVILIAAARTLANHPNVNINIGDGEIHYFSDVNVAIAVSIEDGLVAPVIKNANNLSLEQLSVESKRIIDGARAGTLSLLDYGKGTMTVSNLGMHGIKRFTSIINPPQASILSVGQVRRAPIESADGIAFGWQLSLTMACDHRVIDGTTGTSMLEDLRVLLQSPDSLFA